MSTQAVDHQLLDDARAVADRIVEFFVLAGEDPVASGRIARADTVVHLHLSEAVTVTLRLDRSPVEAELGAAGDPEASLWCSPQHWVACVTGERQLPVAIMRGEAVTAGRVRKLLSVMPILRTLDQTVWARA